MADITGGAAILSRPRPYTHPEKEAEMPLEESVLVKELRRRADREKGPKYNGFPERWWNAGAKRCLNDHVSHMVVKSEALGRDACFRSRCRAPVHLTFPEDKDGPLELTADLPASEVPTWQKLGWFDSNDGWG